MAVLRAPRAREVGVVRRGAGAAAGSWGAGGRREEHGGRAAARAPKSDDNNDVRASLALGSSELRSPPRAPQALKAAGGRREQSETKVCSSEGFRFVSRAK